MTDASYTTRRSELETYFDRTAQEAWKRLTSDAPVSGIRATVRAGREEMRNTLLSWLPADLSGLRLLDAGCGTGAFSAEAAARGAAVVGVDIAGNLVEIARERLPADLAERVEFRVGDMLDPALGRFDHAVAMDSLIHYPTRDIVDAVARLALRVRRSIVFTFAPRTPALAVMHGIGRIFPRGDRAPAIEPVAEVKLRRLIAADPRLVGWTLGRSHRVARGFYISHGLELVRR